MRGERLPSHYDDNHEDEFLEPASCVGSMLEQLIGTVPYEKISLKFKKETGLLLEHT